MIIKLADFKPSQKTSDPQFLLVQSLSDAELFASIASQSFNYRVDSKMIASIINHDENVKLFVGYIRQQPSCCGLVFHDKNGYGGLHMIGTPPQLRGQGLATLMTNYLLQVCIEDGKDWCVLHASAAGEPIYAKLGFEPAKQIITYVLT
ncbi:hypothetical protein C3K47_18735 [Solitalea longa]|uniref:N-acetyltransferase domain-containing protein n=1 Tax=Solitalea longa TaxID=2079460 RepID=A0A2S4ZWM7_9SPHI|nr:GNAT family N-acetyltransferase [Solitalea longa]POY34771.1 hypothetical protein C3K47_18735 [Solitalea longa]